MSQPLSPPSPPSTSFIICSIDPSKFRMISMAVAQRMAGQPHEIIGIHDARSMCEGYNRGMARAVGERLVFCHDDIDLLSGDFSHRLATGLEAYDVVGAAGTDRLIDPVWTTAGPPHLFGQVAHFIPQQNCYAVDQYGIPRRVIGNIQALDGLFFAARRHVAETLRFDEETFRHFHFYDIDFTFRAYLAGFKLAVCCDIHLSHASRGKFSPQWQEGGNLFLQRHGARLARGPRRQFQVGAVIAADKADALNLMNPSWWNAPAAPDGAAR